MALKKYMYTADLDSPRRELSNSCLRIVVALTVFRELFFCAFILGVHSSCSMCGLLGDPLK